MDFWQVIAEAYAALECGYYDDAPAEAVAQAWFDGMSPEEIVEFGAELERMMERARTPLVYAAACLLAGSPEALEYGGGFAGFRASLIALGQESFEAVLADPDILATLPDADAVERGDWDFFMPLHRAPREAFLRAGGAPDDWPNSSSPPGDSEWEADPETLAERFPNLAERFPEGAA